MRKTESQKPGYRVFDFSSVRKRSSVVISRDPNGKALGIHVKGGAEQILRLCKHYYSTEFEKLPMTED
jgi:magnesium-transporting ATPase (P-type)